MRKSFPGATVSNRKHVKLRPETKDQIVSWRSNQQEIHKGTIDQAESTKSADIPI